MNTVSYRPGPQSTQLPTVLCMTWNTDTSCLAVGTQDEFIVYQVQLQSQKTRHATFDPNAEPAGSSAATLASAAPTEKKSGGAPGGARERSPTSFVELSRRHFQGGVSQIAMHNSSSILMLVGASEQYRANVFVWDDSRAPRGADQPKSKCVVAKLSLTHEVKCLRFNEQYVLIGDHFTTYLFDQAFKKIDTYPTPANQGSGASNLGNTTNTIALASSADGDVDSSQFVVRMVVLGAATGSVECVTLPVEGGRRKQAVVEAHERHVHAIGIDATGKTAVTVSERGTAFKVIDLVRGLVTMQLQRGTTARTVNSIAVAHGVAACISDAGTVHCFKIEDRARQQASVVGGTMQGALKLGTSVMPAALARSKYVKAAESYAGAESSFATFRLAGDDDAADDALATTQDAPPLDDSATLLYEADGFGRGAQTQPLTLDLDYVALGLRAGRSEDQLTLVLAQGSLAPAASRVKSRCIHVNIDKRTGESEKLATFLFPKEEL